MTTTVKEGRMHPYVGTGRSRSIGDVWGQGEWRLTGYVGQTKWVS